MKDATVGAVSRVPAQVLPAVPRATPVDPIFTAIERDRIAFVAFAASLSKTDGRKAAQEKGREVTQTDEDAHEAASGVGDELLVNLRMTAFGVRGSAPSFSSPLATIRSASSGSGRRSVGRVRAPVLGYQVIAAVIA
jgi:hypothetical protein